MESHHLLLSLCCLLLVENILTQEHVLCHSPEPSFLDQLAADAKTGLCHKASDDSYLFMNSCRSRDSESKAAASIIWKINNVLIENDCSVTLPSPVEGCSGALACFKIPAGSEAKILQCGSQNGELNDISSCLGRLILFGCPPAIKYRAIVKHVANTQCVKSTTVRPPSTITPPTTTKGYKKNPYRRRPRNRCRISKRRPSSRFMRKRPNQRLRACGLLGRRRI